MSCLSGRHGVLLLSFILGAVACGGGEKLAMLKSQASVDMQCPVDQVGRRDVQPYVEHVNACGKEAVYVYDHGAERWVSPLDRASFDLSCPKEQMITQVLDTRSVGVSGCGKKSVYVLTQSLTPGPMGGAMIQNSWVGNNAVSEAK